MCTMGKDLMIVVDMPTEGEARRGERFTSRRYKIMREVMEKAIGYPMDNAHLTVLSETRPEGVKYLTEKEIKEGRVTLMQEIAEVKPKAILAVGEAPFTALTEQKGAIKKSGDLFAITVADEIYKVIPCYTPGYAAMHRDNKAMFEKYAKSIYRAVFVAEGGSVELDFTEWQMVKSLEEVNQVIEYCQQTGICSLDVETTGLDRRKDKVTLITVSFQIGSSWLIPIDHFESPFTETEKDDIIEALHNGITINPNVKKLGWNFKYDMHMLATYGIDFAGQCLDGITKHHIIDENERHGLKKVGPEFYPELENYEYIVSGYAWDKVPLKILCEYAAVDSDITLRLHFLLTEILLEEPELYRLSRNLSNPATQWTYECESHGMKIDRPFLETCIQELGDRINKVDEELRSFKDVQEFEINRRQILNQEAINDTEKKLEGARARAKNGSNAITDRYETAIRRIKSGEDQVYDGINWNSPVQLQELFYRSSTGFNFDMPYVRQKGGPYPSTAKDFIKELPDTTGFIKKFIFYRRLMKLHSTYFNGILDRLHSDDYIRAEWIVWGTVTGRLSSRDPNLQNIPRAGNDEVSEWAKKVKELFIAPEGMCIIQVDYSQAEIRLVAEAAQEQVMIKTYQDGGDIHTLTAVDVKGLSLAEWNNLTKEDQKEWRFRAKAVNFGFMYGMSAESFQDYCKNEYNIHITYAEAVDMRRKFFNLYPALEAWHKKSIRRAEQQGYVTTLFGRRRRLPDIDDSDDYLVGMAQRAAINAPIQGTAGEFTIFAASILRNRMLFVEPMAQIVNNVHDSIMIYCPIGSEDKVVRLARETMKNLPIKEYFETELLHVSMEVDAEVGPSWGTMEDYIEF